jgi:hypothetical protein
MSYDEDEEVDINFKVGAGDDIDEPLDMPLDIPEDMPNFDLDDEDPDKDK